MLMKELVKACRLSEATKMPCYTYSLSRKTCQRGSKLAKIEGTVCNKCYAKRGNFCRPTIQKGLALKKQAIEHKSWVNVMVKSITFHETSGFFRWHSSGDLQSLEHLKKICSIVRKTPQIKHWLPTHEVGILGEFKRAGLKFPKNLVVRISADFIESKPSNNLMRNLGVLGCAVSNVKWSCPAYEQGGKCGKCRKCWNKGIKIVTYKYH